MERTRHKISEGNPNARDNRSRERICMGSDHPAVVAGVPTDLHSRRRQAGGFAGKWLCRRHRRLSARIAANDVTGLTDSLRGGLHIEHTGNWGGSLYTTRIRSSERTDARRATRTLTDYYTSNMDLRGGRHNSATNAQSPPRTGNHRTPPGKLPIQTIQYWPEL